MIDASAVLPDGTRFAGLPGLRNILLARKDSSRRPLPKS
jgi:hypothetical protein